MIQLGIILVTAVVLSIASGTAHGKMVIQTFPVLAGAGPHDVYPAPDGAVWFTATLLHGSAVRRRGLDGVSGTPFLTLGSHRAVQSQPRSPSSHPEAAAQSDELGCL